MIEPAQEKLDALMNAAEDEQQLDSLVGTIFAGRYQILELIGSGGWGHVYKAVHPTLGTDVAIKIIHKHMMNDEDGLKRFEQEAQLLNKLNSSKIVRIVDYDLLPFPFIVMEYFDGDALSSILQKNGIFAFDLATDLFMQICEGLKAAAELGLVHRDLKPGNILCKISAGKMQVKILDFGIAKLVENSNAKLTATGEVLGSPPYMSPEQWVGKTDQRSDLYSLGCIMYEVVSGKRPFQAEFGVEYLNQHLNKLPPRFEQYAKELKIPNGLERVIRKCLQKSPEHRYQSSDAIYADLQRLKAGKSVRISLPDDEIRPILSAVPFVGVFLVLMTFLFIEFHEPVAAVICDALISRADREVNSDKPNEAIWKYKCSIELSRFLKPNDERKIHSLTMLSFLLKQSNQRQNAIELDKQIDQLTLELSNEMNYPHAKAKSNSFYGPGQSRVRLVDKVPAVPEKLWQFIGKFDAMPWHPSIVSGVVGQEGTHLIRTLVNRSVNRPSAPFYEMNPGAASASGMEMKEELLSSTQNSIRYKIIAGLPVHPIVTLSVEPDGNGGSLISWSEIVNDSDMDESTAKKITDGLSIFFRDGVDSLQEHYLKRLILKPPTDTPSCIEIADYTLAPDSLNLARTLIAKCDEHYERCRSELGLATGVASKKFDIMLIAGKDAPQSATMGNQLIFNVANLAPNLAMHDYSALIWQMTIALIEQGKPADSEHKAPLWLIRAIASFVQAKIQFPENQVSARDLSDKDAPPDSKSVEADYKRNSKRGGDFLLFIDQKYRKQRVVPQIISTVINGKYTEKSWQLFSGYTCAELFTQFAKTRSRNM